MKFLNVVKDFKDKNEYLSYRNNMLNEAEQLMNDGKLEESNAKLKDVEELDEDFKNHAETKANLTALSGSGIKPKTDITNLAGTSLVDKTDKNITNDIYDSVEYRTAFMNNVINGTPIPAQFKNDNTKTADVASVIPTTTMNKIIEKLETVGNIYAKVTKTSYKGGVAIPTSTVKPVASWVAEGAGSELQKKTTGKIIFNYYKLRCAISMSIETQTMALSAFETKFVENVTTAMIKAIEQGIFTGTGTNQMTGILTETIEDSRKINIAKTKSITYKDLCAAEAVLPEEYENGAEWYLSLIHI